MFRDLWLVSGLGCIPLMLKAGDWFACYFINFQGADYTSGIVGADALGGLGVDGLQFAIELPEAFGPCPFSEPPADLLIGAGAVEQAEEQGLDIEGCAADGYYRPALLFYIFDCLIYQLDESADVERFAGFNEVDEVIFDCFAGLSWRLGGADVHSPIDLHRVDTDYFSTDFLCQVKGEP